MEPLEHGEEVELYFDTPGAGSALAVFRIIAISDKIVMLRWIETKVMELVDKHANIIKIIGEDATGNPRLVANIISLDREEIFSRSRENRKTARKINDLYRKTGR